ncbi:endonuclease G, mitochondrial [Caerostris darwini]|uniref:Endonuclease G, mitochondrial n=1 Tax=Caerostris darwini TaxID=1538125 RepID=A0AAV4NKH6_9ARAC|nr:endonuclease G, mitochondrial [Caerostris darwini]
MFNKWMSADYSSIPFAFKRREHKLDVAKQLVRFFTRKETPAIALTFNINTRKTIFAAFYSSFDLQMAVRCIVASAVGFYSGILYKDRCLLKKCEVYAANPVVPINPSQPVEINVDDHVSQTMQFGFPGVDTLLVKKSFILSYDRKNKVPHWVFEHLTPEHIAYNKDVNRSKSSFFEEDSIHVYFRSTNSDYKRCDFRRGHLAAAGNHRSKQEFIDDTFVLSNIAPQIADKKFEDNGWNKLEKHVREMVKKYKNVYVCTGPLYFPRMESDGKKYIKYQVIGKNNVAVPTHFFKVIAYEKEGSLFDIESYVIPNQTIDDVPLKSFFVPKDVIERATGLLLFEKLPKTNISSINGKPIDNKQK